MTDSPSLLEGVRQSYIYALLDPETLQPRYVGKTWATPNKRLRQRIHQAKTTKISGHSGYVSLPVQKGGE